MFAGGNGVLKPRNGHTLVVAIPARISGCANQKEISLEDQVDNAKELVAQIYDGPTDFRIIATKAKGEQLDRPELKEIEDLLRSGTIDLFIMEDVGRLVRGSEACRLWGIAFDRGTRCIAPHDTCDTADPNWEEKVMQACAAHVAHNAAASKRLKHKSMNRFKKYGGIMSLPIAGYVKPEGAKTYDAWQKVESATPVIRAGLQLLEQTLNCSAVADYFNEIGFAPGPYAKKAKWDGAMVRRYYKNRLLAGMPGRGFKTSVKNYETGRRRSVKNTHSAPVFLHYPHLKHVSAEELDAVNARLAEANKDLGRLGQNGVDSLAGKPKKRTKFPGQHCTCWYCGRQYVWGANGVKDGLMCNGPRSWLCWNSIGVNSRFAVDKVVESVRDALISLEGFNDQFAALVELSSLEDDSADRRAQILQQQQELAQQRERIVNAVAKLGLSDDFENKLAAIKLEEAALSKELQQLDAFDRRELGLPSSASELRLAFEESVATLSSESWQFGELLRKIVPEFRIYLVRSVDGGPLLPRAQVRFDLSGHVQAAAASPQLKRLTERKVTIDLFDRPEHELIRSSVVSMAATGMSLAAIAASLPVPTTVRKVQNALRLHQAMVDSGVDDPYVFVDSPPEDLKKFRRHRNSRYHFTPLDGYQPPLLGDIE